MKPIHTLVLLLAASLVTACGGGDSSPTIPPEILTAQNSTDPAIMHWESNTGTGGPYFYISFHEDGTGIINANNGATTVYVGAGNTRELLDFTWDVPEEGTIVVTIASLSRTIRFTSVVFTPDAQGFSATVTGDMDDTDDLIFMKMAGEPNCC